MPAIRGTRRTLLALRKSLYIFLDQFVPDLAAGAVDETPSSDGQACRQVTDTDSKLSISGGKLLLAAHSTPAWGDPGIWWTQPDCAAGWDRVAGRTFSIITQHGAGSDYMVGWDTDTAGQINDTGFRINAAVQLYRRTTAAKEKIGTLALATDYTFKTMLRDTGAYHTIDGGIFGAIPLLCGIDDTLTTDPAFPAVSNNDGAITISSPALVKDFTVITPDVSDTFSDVTAIDSGANGLDGTHVKVSLDGTSGRYAGTGYTNIYSSALNTWWSGSELSIIARFQKPSGWGADTFDKVVSIQVDAANRALIQIGGTVNSLNWYYAAGGTAETITKSGLSTTAIQTLGLTVSKSNDRMIASYDGAREGAIQTGLGIYAGALSATGACIAAQTTVPAGAVSGGFPDVILFNLEISEADMASLHTLLDAGTLTAADLTTYATNAGGTAANWAWYKLNEQSESDGLVLPIDSITSVGAEELSEAGASGTATVANWTAVSGAVLSNPSVGVLGVVALATDAGSSAGQTALTIGETINYVGEAKGDGVNGLPRITDGVGTYWSGTTSTDWQEFDVEFVAQGTDIRNNTIGNAATEDTTQWRNLSVKQITAGAGSGVPIISGLGTTGNAGYHTVIPGADLSGNSNFVNWTGVSPNDQPDGWTTIEDGVNNYVTENPADECQFISNGGDTFIRLTATAGSWIRCSVTASAVASGAIRVGTQAVANKLGELSAPGTLAGTFLASAAAFDNIINIGRKAACDVTASSALVSELPITDLLSLRELSDPEFFFRMAITMAADTQAGAAFCADSATSPANFGLAIMNRGDDKIYVYSVVAGVYTAIASAAFTYSAGTLLDVRPNPEADTVYVTYNGALIIEAAVVNNAAIIDNTLHGTFSTDNDTTFEDYRAIQALRPGIA